MLSFSGALCSHRRLLAGNQSDLDALHCRFRILAATVRTAGAELRSMISTEKTGSSGQSTQVLLAGHYV
ncbi:hypothetical protein CesoFtcFv8_011690 [Champsocephalus esox]|uniref:Uncharacterized protein n=1 Tax=Champsocephalus esox TaxID=159716 RepID=A0AAN8C0W2_9TELE|nr:hypothetical protein CesoFtcFv8_011690 [Champsocephalus esox]